MVCAFRFASRYLSWFPPAFFNFHNLFSDISLLTFSFQHHVCFLQIPYFVHPQVFSVTQSKLCFNLDQILSSCLPLVSFISPIKVSQNLSRRSACWSYHTRRFGTPILQQFLTLISTFCNFCITN